MKKLNFKNTFYLLLASVSLTATSNSQIIYKNLNDLIISGAGKTVPLDIDNDGQADLSLAVIANQFESNICGPLILEEATLSTSINTNVLCSTLGNKYFPTALDLNSTIGNTSDSWYSQASFTLATYQQPKCANKSYKTWFGHGHSSYWNITQTKGEWNYISDKYLGFKISKTGYNYYGWLRLSVTAVRSDLYYISEVITAKDYAFQSSSDAPIMAGETNTVSPARPSQLANNLMLQTQATLGKSSTSPSLQFARCLGGSGDEAAFSNFMTQTNDGGFISCSYSTSTNGDVTGNHGGVDVWIVKYNSSGATEWEKSYGGSGDDFANRAIQTSDGGYIFLGYTYSHDGDVSVNYGEGDLWIVKLSSRGIISWQKNYGGSGDEFAYYGIIQTTDGGYAAIGSSASHNGVASGNHGGYDVLILKLTNNGEIQWTKTYGGSQDEYGNLIVQNTDGSYTITADTYSNNGNINGNHGAIDTWVARLNSNGNIIWKKCLGGSDEEYNASLIATRDGNILIGDYAGSHDGDVIGNHGVLPNGGDMWLVKINLSTGNIIWTKTLGGSNGNTRVEYPDDEVALFINELESGEFLIAGGSTSSNGDLTVNRGVGDCWVLKLNANGNIIWQKSFGGSDEEAATAIFQNKNGSFIVAGWTYSNDFDFKHSGQHGKGDLFIATLSADNVSPSITQVSKSNYPVENENKYHLKSFPNPFSQFSTITFSIAQTGKVSLKIYDVSGRLIKTLCNEIMQAGTHEIQWNARDKKGIIVPSGIYLMQIKVGNYSETQKLLALTK